MKLKFGKLGKDTFLLTIGMGLRSIAQGLVFIIIARSMGADGYGAFVSIIAIAGMLSGLVGFGSHVLLIRDTALNHKQFHQAWGTTLTNIVISIPLIFCIYLIVTYAILSSSINLIPIILLGIADIIFWPLSNSCVAAYQGFERMGRTSRMILVPVTVRLLAAIIFLGLVYQFEKVDLLQIWSYLYLSAAIITTIYTQWMVYTDIGKPLFSERLSVKRIKESLPFAFWGLSDKIYVDADKIMLARMTTMDITGVYSAAYRLIEITLIPIQGLLRATSTKFFRIANNDNILYSIQFAIRLIKLPLLYATLLTFGIFYFSNLITFLLGEDFEKSIQVIKYLSLYPLLILPRMFLQHILASSGLQKVGMLTILSGGLLNIFSNFILIPLWSWKGAIISTYLSEIFMMIVMIIILRYKHNNSVSIA